MKIIIQGFFHQKKSKNLIIIMEIKKKFNIIRTRSYRKIISSIKIRREYLKVRWLDWEIISWSLRNWINTLELWL